MSYLITIEGRSGVGKTTLGNIIESILKNAKKQYERIGGFETTNKDSFLIKAINELIKKDRFIRTNWYRETSLLLAEFLERIYEDVLPALNDGKSVIFECYYESLVVYQSARLSEDPKFQNWSYKQLLQYVTSIITPYLLDLPSPDIIFFVTLSNETELKERLIKRDSRAYSNRDTFLQRKIEEMYSHVLENNINVIRLDTSILSEEQEKQFVEKVLKEKGAI